jgi:SecD/SecF fusion protein
LCLTPVVLAALVTWRAYENDGFKKGVDLSGGTILVYEIDTRKKEKRAGEDERSDPQADTALLAEALKRRIDPTSTYDIKIRPAGAGGRVEIILPTGGEERARKAQAAWDELLQQMKKEWQLSELDVGRGKVSELVATIQNKVSERTWATKVFNTPAAWNALIAEAQKKWLQLKQFSDPREVDAASVVRLVGGKGSPAWPLAAVVAYQGGVPIDTLLHRLPPGQLPELTALISRELEDIALDRPVATWIKEQAWNQLLERVTKEWPGVTKAHLEGIPPDSFEELVGRIEAKGNIFTQAALETLRPLMGEQPIRSGLNDRAKIVQFITNNYGPSPASIEERIARVTGQDVGQTRDLTVEEVQRIKELVARVGSLEFKILANDHDDKQAIKDSIEYFSNPIHLDTLKAKAVRGEPPPGPLMPGSETELKAYTITLPHDTKSIVTYSWVELGPQERRQLGLDNASRTSEEAWRKARWDYAKTERTKGTAFQIPQDPRDPKGPKLLQGALFYSRAVEDRNMPEEQKRKKQFEYFVLARNPEIDPASGKETPKIDGSKLRNAYVSTESGRPSVSFVFNEEGGELFGTLTGKNVPSGAGGEESQIKRHLAIILDGLIMSAPTINSRISTHGQITGHFTRKEVDNLVNILRSGALPATLKQQPVSETTIGATLGADTIESAYHAIVIAYLAVVAFMIVYYRFAGLVASVALFANLLLTVGFMVFVQATFTLPGLAGLVLMLGMAVDANVLIYERFREERDRGASLALAIRNGYDRAFPTIIDTHLTGIFTAIVLYVVGNDQLKGFGVSLTVGLIISLFTSLIMTRLMFDIWLSRGWLHKLSMARLLSKTDFDFMGIRYYMLTFTVLITVLGVAVFVARLPADLNIDFVGGTAYSGQLVKGKGVNMKELRDLLSEEKQKQLLDVTGVERLDKEGRQFHITYKDPGGGTDVRTVLLANVAPGDTKEEQEANILTRARELPDLAVEQTFPSFAQEEDPEKSRFFTVRTSEKETELVQAELDRLLRDKDKQGHYHPLMKKIALGYNTAHLEAKGKEIILTFTEFDKRAEPDYASPSFVKTLFMRELEKEFGVTRSADLPFVVELTGVGKSKEDRFAQMRLAFLADKALPSDQIHKVEAALARTKEAFEARPAPERLENFDSELAADTRLRAMWAILLSWGGILLYLWFRFGNWTFGLAAVLCLIHDLFFTLGIIAFCHYIHQWWPGFLGIEDFKIDLTAVAALLTLVGYSVNDTIVVFDRIREVRGKNPDLTLEMINDSVNQTLSRTILTSTTAWLVVIVLYILGGPGVHLFAFVMVVGVVVGTYSSIYVASPLLLIFGEGARSKAGVLQRRPQPVGASG